MCVLTNRNIYTRKIAITGPESTGKSTIAQALAAHYQSVWVPEYAREYLDLLNRRYLQEDLLKIAKGQLAAEEEKLKEPPKYLFCDTDLLVIKIWSEHKYGEIDPFILKEYQNSKYDLYLLMDIDLPWCFDSQREHPVNRKYFFNWFENELIQKQANYMIINGNQEERLQNAIRIIDQNFR